jgi:hypothetical protein
MQAVQAVRAVAAHPSGLGRFIHGNLSAFAVAAE